MKREREGKTKKKERKAWQKILTKLRRDNNLNWGGGKENSNQRQTQLNKITKNFAGEKVLIFYKRPTSL